MCYNKHRHPKRCVRAGALPEVFLLDAGPVVTVGVVNGGASIPDIVTPDGTVIALTDDDGDGMFSSVDLALLVPNLSALTLQMALLDGTPVPFSFNGEVVDTATDDPPFLTTFAGASRLPQLLTTKVLDQKQATASP